MRISDWSSDVCSSDLRAAPARLDRARFAEQPDADRPQQPEVQRRGRRFGFPLDRPPPPTAGSLTARDRYGGPPVRSGAIFPDQPSPFIDELADTRRTRSFVQPGDREDRTFHLSMEPTRTPACGFHLL